MILVLDPCSSCGGNMFSSWCDVVASRKAAEMSTKCRDKIGREMETRWLSCFDFPHPLVVSRHSKIHHFSNGGALVPPQPPAVLPPVLPLLPRRLPRPPVPPAAFPRPPPPLRTHIRPRRFPPLAHTHPSRRTPGRTARVPRRPEGRACEAH